MKTPNFFIKVDSVGLCKEASAVAEVNNNIFLSFFISSWEGVGRWGKIEIIDEHKKYKQSFLLSSAGFFVAKFTGERSNVKKDTETCIIKARFNLKSKRIHLLSE